LFRAWYKDGESLQLKSTGDDRFAVALTAKYGASSFMTTMVLLRDSLRQSMVVLLKLSEGASEQPVKGYGYKYCILICLPGYDIMNHTTDSLRKNETYKSCTKVMIFIQLWSINTSSIQRKPRKWV